MMTVLPTPAPPKRPVLPPLVNGRDQVDDLDAGLEDLDLGRLLVERRAPAGGSGSASWPRPGRPVDRLADHVEDAAERLLADRHGDRRAGVDRRPCRGAGRRSSPWRRRGPSRCRGAAAPRASRASSPSSIWSTSTRVVDLRQLVRRELDVDDRPMTWTILPGSCCLLLVYARRAASAASAA